MLPSILMVLADEDATIRRHAFALAKAFVNNTVKNQIDVFAETEKSKSTKKKAPGISEKAQAFLKEVCKFESEIIQDRTQLNTALNKSSHKDVFELMLKAFLDWPTDLLKQQLLEILSLVDDHTLTFTLTLSDALNKLYSHIGDSKKP